MQQGISPLPLLAAFFSASDEFLDEFLLTSPDRSWYPAIHASGFFWGCRSTSREILGFVCLEVGFSKLFEAAMQAFAHGLEMETGVQNSLETGEGGYCQHLPSSGLSRSARQMPA